MDKSFGPAFAASPVNTLHEFAKSQRRSLPRGLRDSLLRISFKSHSRLCSRCPAIAGLRKVFTLARGRGIRRSVLGLGINRSPQIGYGKASP